jgi:hypothetical protein
MASTHKFGKSLTARRLEAVGLQLAQRGVFALPEAVRAVYHGEDKYAYPGTQVQHTITRNEYNAIEHELFETLGRK